MSNANHIYNEKLSHLIEEALHEDVGSGDYSTLCCIPEQAIGKAMLKVKQPCIIAGVDVAKTILLHHNPNIEFEALHKDGDKVNNGDIVFYVTAPVHTLLSCERLLLNCMQRMSGIATLTNEYSSLLKPYATKLLDTRKTTPNFRLLEKEAVKIGGGYNHRFGLYDMIMLKDNHIDFCGGISKAIHQAHQYIQQHHLQIGIEVETRNLDDVSEVVAHGLGKVQRIMLDNFQPQQIKEALHIINKQFETEASGGINKNNIIDYAETGVDFISVGGLIHQAVSIDLSFKAVI